MIKQPFLFSPWKEILFIVSPAFIVSLIVIIFGSIELSNETETGIFWLIVVVFIDVAHVYATLFRTYFNKIYFRERKKLFVLTPLLCFIGSYVIYSVFGFQYFWRILAYLAVFHFIRQQYGFFSLYSRFENNAFQKLIGNLAIYSATLYPILHWHLSLDKTFNWFVKDDFYFIKLPGADMIFFSIYITIIIIYYINELYVFWKTRYLNFPKNGILLGTLLSWYIGIVYFNSDIVFTLLNVVAHGIPYMFFVYLFSKNKMGVQSDTVLGYFFKPLGILLFFIVLFLFAYTEEGFWDALIWHEHKDLFPAFENSYLDLESKWVTFFTCLLTLPQLTHYILDGFVWKTKRDHLI